MGKISDRRWRRDYRKGPDRTLQYIKRHPRELADLMRQNLVELSYDPGKRAVTAAALPTDPYSEKVK